MKLPNPHEWTLKLIQEYDDQIQKTADEFSLDRYPYQIEIISSEQMISAYASVGMPVNYYHWSFGKKVAQLQKKYKKGEMGLAYEIVINSNPCIAYLMEDNTMMMQALVLAHAAQGHNSFFKNNYLFKTWTQADGIIDYLLFAKKYISECEEKYSEEKVEKLLDACHALMNLGVDKYKRPQKISLQKEKQRQKKRQEIIQQQINELWEKTIPKKSKKQEAEKEDVFPKEPQENILYFMEKHAPLLEPWEREIVRIVRKIAQYFYPQRQTQVMNEGWATFWHYTIINKMYEKGLLYDSFMIEFLQSHTNVIFQPPFESPIFSGINPYALGFAMFCDIKRICQNPTKEDKAWFPDIAGSNWQETLDFAMRNFKDESFILQFLSPKLIRDFKFISLKNEQDRNYLEVSAIHNEQGYKHIRKVLANQYDLSFYDPDIQIQQANIKTDRSLILRYKNRTNKPLDKKSAKKVLSHISYLWRFTTILEEEKPDGTVEPLYMAEEEIN